MTHDAWATAERASAAVHGGRLITSGIYRALNSRFESERDYARTALDRNGHPIEGATLTDGQRSAWWGYHIVPASGETNNESLARYAEHMARGGDPWKHKPPMVPEAVAEWPIYRAAIEYDSPKARAERYVQNIP